MITLAHISDVHLAPLPLVTPRELASKRLTGWLNWQFKRRGDMRPETLTALLDHLKAHDPDMTAVTGDMVNLALDEEITRAASWFTGLGDPEKVCAIPGNHDAYVPGALEKAISAYGNYMRGETLDNQPFPYVRRLGMVAMIGVSSAVTTPPFFAAGKVGADQIERLRKLLALLGEAGYFRVVMIHHPPHAEFADSRRLGLWDGSDFRAVLKQAGAEMILHGHTPSVLDQRHTGPVSGNSSDRCCRGLGRTRGSRRPRPLQSFPHREGGNRMDLRYARIRLSAHRRRDRIAAANAHILART